MVLARTRQLGLLSKAADGQVELLVQLFQVQPRQVPHLRVLEVLAAPLPQAAGTT